MVVRHALSPLLLRLLVALPLAAVMGGCATAGPAGGAVPPGGDADRGGRDVAAAWALAVAATLRDHMQVPPLPPEVLAASSVTVELEAVSLDGAVLAFSIPEHAGAPEVAAAARTAVGDFLPPEGTARLPAPSATLAGYVERYGLAIRFDGSRLVGDAAPRVATPCGCRRTRR